MTANSSALAVAGPSNFSLQLRKEYVENRRQILICLGALCGLAALAGTFLGWVGVTNGPIAFYLAGAGLGSWVVASMMFGPLKTRSGIISMLMTPSSMRAKFMVRWLAAVPLLLVVLLGASYLFEFFVSLADWMFNGSPWSFEDPFGLLAGLCREHEEAKWFVLTMFSLYLMSQSFYLVGAVLWPKLSFLKTMISLWVLQLVAQGIFVVAVLNHDWVEEFVINFDGWKVWQGALLVNLPILLVTAGCWFVAYKLFTNVNINRLSSRR